MEVRLLGPVALVSGGADVPLGGAKQRAIFAVLALRSPRLATTEQIIDAVWGAEPPKSARNAVQVYLSGLRKALGEGVEIERSGDAYRLVGADLTIDASEFVAAVAEGRSALRSGDAPRAARLLAAALEAWIGEPLGGIEGLPFHGSASRGLTDARAVARLDRAESLIRQGSLDEAQTEARTAIAERPYEEQAWSALARAQYLAGRQRDALDTCRDLRNMLAEDLGIDPSPALAELEIAILNQTVEGGQLHEPPAAPPVEPPVRPSLPPLPFSFVGRESLVREAVDRLATHRFVSLVGLGGIGKTTLARAVSHRLNAQGCLVHFCELETATTPRAALERVCRQVGLDPDQPDISFAALDDDVLVVLDNVEQVSDFGPALAAAWTGSRASLLVTSRRPLHMRGEVVLHVGPLSLHQAGAGPSPAAALFLAHAQRARPGLDLAAALPSGERVCEMLDGIPLAIELTASRTRVLTVDQVAARLQSGAASALDPSRMVDVPARQVSLRSIVESTIEALSESASVLLDWLAAMDGWTSLELLEAVAGAESGGEAGIQDVIGSVEDLVDSGLVDAHSDGRVRLHTPIRDYLKQRGQPSARDMAVLDAVEQLVAEVAPTLFGTTSAAGLDRLERDHDTVMGSLARAIEQDRSRPAAAITLGLNRYWLLSGRVVEAARWIVATRSLNDLSSVDECRLDILAGTFASYLSAPAAVGQLVEALGRAENLGVPADRLVVNGWCCLAAAEARGGNTDVATAHAVEAARIAERSGNQGLRNLARDVGGYVAANRGDFEAALEVTLASLAEARQRDDVHDVVALLVSAIDDLMGLYRVDEALDFSTEAFQLVRDLRTGPWLFGHVLTAHATALLAAGRVAESRGLLTEGVRIASVQFPDPTSLADRLALLAVGFALERSDEMAARLWGAAETMGNASNSPRNRLSPILVGHIDDLAERLDGRFKVLRVAGATAPEHLLSDLLG